MSSFKIQAITVIPAVVIFLLAIYLAMLSFITNDPSMRQQLVFVALALLPGGVTMAVCWIFYWAMQKTPLMKKQNLTQKSKSH